MVIQNSSGTSSAQAKEENEISIIEENVSIAHTTFGTEPEVVDIVYVDNSSAQPLPESSVTSTLSSFEENSKPAIEACEERPVARVKKKILSREEKKEQVYKYVLDGVPLSGIAALLRTKVKDVKEIIGDLWEEGRKLDLPNFEYEVIGTGHKIKEIVGSGFDKCKHVHIDINEDGSVTLRPFVMGENHG